MVRKGNSRRRKRKNTNNTRLKFNSQIYSEDALKKAVCDYAQIADINIKKSRGYYLVNIKNIKPEIRSAIKDEFANYVLGLTKKCL